MNASEWDRAALWHYRGKFLYVHDADTIVVMIDNGMKIRHETRIRIEGLWEPELWTEEGKARAAALDYAVKMTLVTSKRAWDVRVITTQLKTKADEDTSFDRWVANVWLVTPVGEMIDLKATNPFITTLLRRGLAH